MAQLRIQKTGDQATDMNFTAMKSELDPIIANKITQGNLIESTLRAGQNQVNHLLQRQPLGWLVTDQNTTSDIYRVSWDKNFIVLNASAPVTIGLWVF